MEPAEYQCRDARVISARCERCFDVLMDLSTYARWWTLITVTPESEAMRLAPGVRFEFAGVDQRGERVAWPVVVLEIEAPRRIEWAYAGGEYLGRTAWELEGRGEETQVAYVYRGVRPNTAHAVAHFARWGTRLHTVAMQEDALAGMARLLGGPGAELDDDAWRRDVRRRVAAGIRQLGSG